MSIGALANSGHGQRHAAMGKAIGLANTVAVAIANRATHPERRL